MFLKHGFFRSLQFYLYLIFLAIVLVVFIVVFSFLFSYTTKNYVSETFVKLEKKSAVLREMVNNQFFHIYNDLSFISSDSTVKRIFTATSMNKSELLDQEFKIYFQHKKQYQGITFLSERGIKFSYFNNTDFNSKFLSLIYSFQESVMVEKLSENYMYISDMFYINYDSDGSTEGSVICSLLVNHENQKSVVSLIVKGSEFLRYFDMASNEYETKGIQLLNGNGVPRFTRGYVPAEDQIVSQDDFNDGNRRIPLKKAENSYLKVTVEVKPDLSMYNLKLIPLIEGVKLDCVAFFQMYYNLDTTLLEGRLFMKSILIIVCVSIVAVLSLLFFIGYLSYSRSIANRELVISSEIFKNASEGILITNRNFFIQFANESFFSLSDDFKPENIINQKIDVIHTINNKESFFEKLKTNIEDYSYWKGEISLELSNGGTRPCLLTVREIKGGSRTDGYIAIFEDLEMLKSKENQAKMLENYDSETGLPNSYLFRRRLKESMLSAGKENRLCAVMVIALHDYNRMLETYGQSFSSDFLKAASDSLYNAARDVTMVARLQGNTFGIIFPSQKTRNEIYMIANNIFEYLSMPLKVHDETIFLKFNGGVSVFPEDGTNTDLMLKNAHIALKIAVNTKPNIFKFFKFSNNENSVNMLRMETSLRQAIKNEDFSLRFQPQFTLDGLEVIGCEALIRWQHARMGFISPAIFIPLAESSGLINDIGEWVMKAAFLQVVAWEKYIDKNFRMAVNISPHQFHDKYFISKVDYLLDKTGVNPSFLEFEITEGVLVQDRESVIRKIHEIKERGIDVSLDDFGTGYSSLSYIRDFPLDKIKIDRSFIMGYPESDDGIVARIIVDMTKKLKLSVIAEGIETEQQLDFLRKIDCYSGQGFFFSPPVLADDFEKKYLI